MEPGVSSVQDSRYSPAYVDTQQQIPVNSVSGSYGTTDRQELSTPGLAFDPRI